MARTYLMKIVDEGTTVVFTAQLVDAQLTPVAAGQLTELWMTFYDAESLTIVGSWDRVNILNANGVTLDAEGHLGWVIPEEDMGLIDDTLDDEERVILIEARWLTAGIPRVAYEETVFRIRNVAKVPQEV